MKQKRKTWEAAKALDSCFFVFAFMYFWFSPPHVTGRKEINLQNSRTFNMNRFLIWSRLSTDTEFTLLSEKKMDKIYETTIFKTFHLRQQRIETSKRWKTNEVNS